MFLDRRLPMDDLIGYWIAQFLGAIAASLVVLIAYDDDDGRRHDDAGVDDLGRDRRRIVMTAVFVAVILQSTKSERVRGTALLAIPLTLARDPRRDHPDQRLVGEPGAQLRRRRSSAPSSPITGST